LWTFTRRSAKIVGVVAVRLANTLITPLFSATKTRPSGEKRIEVGLSRPEKTTVSWKPLGTAAATGRIRPERRPGASVRNLSCGARSLAGTEAPRREKTTTGRLIRLWRTLFPPGMLASASRRFSCNRDDPGGRPSPEE
jgi:hypothetical protein